MRGKVKVDGSGIAGGSASRPGKMLTNISKLANTAEHALGAGLKMAGHATEKKVGFEPGLGALNRSLP